MSPENRMILRKSMTVEETVNFYASMKSSPDAGPRLSRDEWISLGQEGQKALHPSLKPWEIKIVYDWLDQHDIETAVTERRAEASSIVAGSYVFLLIGGNAAILLSGALLGGFLGFVLACILSCFFDMIVALSIKAIHGMK